MNEFKCPVCQNNMIAALGNQIHPGDAQFGITMYCGGTNCSAADVQGHGSNEKSAYEIVCEKFKRHKG